MRHRRGRHCSRPFSFRGRTEIIRDIRRLYECVARQVRNAGRGPAARHCLLPLRRIYKPRPFVGIRGDASLTRSFLPSILRPKSRIEPSSTLVKSRVSKVVGIDSCRRIRWIDLSRAPEEILCSNCEKGHKRRLGDTVCLSQLCEV